MKANVNHPATSSDNGVGAGSDGRELEKGLLSFKNKHKLEEAGSQCHPTPENWFGKS